MEYRRSIFIINKPFQIRYVLYVCSWLFALSLVYPLIIYNLFDLLLRHSEKVPALQSLHDARTEVLWLLVFLQALFLGVTIIISVFVSHRIAGPLYKLSKFLKEATRGKLRDDLKFRKSDHFKDLAEDYNQMIRSIQEQIKKRDADNKEASDKIQLALEQTNEAGRQYLRDALGLLQHTEER